MSKHLQLSEAKYIFVESHQHNLIGLGLIVIDIYLIDWF